MITINQTPNPPASIIVNFGWWFNTSPQREPEYTYTINGQSFPPGYTTLSSSLTIPAVTTPLTTFTTHVVSTSNFDIDTPASIVVNNGTTWALINYQAISGNTFTGCTSIGTGTFTSTTPVWDPRFYIDSAPLRTPIFFDAIDSENLGLNQIFQPPGIEAILYRWDLGNGTIGYGPTVSTTYPYDQAPPNTIVKLSVLDSLNRTTSCSYPLTLLPPTIIEGSATREGG